MRAIATAHVQSPLNARNRHCMPANRTCGRPNSTAADSNLTFARILRTRQRCESRMRLRKYLSTTSTLSVIFGYKRETRAPRTPRPGDERRDGGWTPGGRIERNARGPDVLGSEQPDNGINAVHADCRRHFLPRHDAGHRRRLHYPRGRDSAAAIGGFRLPASSVIWHNRWRE